MYKILRSGCRRTRHRAANNPVLEGCHDHFNNDETQNSQPIPITELPMTKTADQPIFPRGSVLDTYQGEE